MLMIFMYVVRPSSCMMDDMACYVMLCYEMLRYTTMIPR
jgi:hypothetical protein